MSGITTYNQKFIEAIEAAPDCETLMQLSAKIQTYYVDKLIGQMRDLIEQIEPLTEIPDDLGSVISWITSFINLNVLSSYNKMIALEAEAVAQYTLTIAAITSKISSMSCVFSPPDIDELLP